MANKKAEGMSTEKIITIILVLVVIVTVLMFLFRSQISAYINNLPGYQYNAKDKEITVTGQQQTVSRCKQVGYFGAVEGMIIAWGGKQYIWLKDDTGSYAKTKLYVKGNFENNDIIFDKNWAIDPKVGSISGSKVGVNSDVLSGPSLTGATYEQLKNLDGSQTKGNLILVCK
jgi:hypothetical protein